MPQPSIFGARLRQSRIAKNITQTELSKLSGVSRVSILALELGRNQSTSDKNIIALAKHIGCTFEFLKFGIAKSDAFDPDVRDLALRLSKISQDRRSKLVTALNAVIDLV